MRYDVVIRNGTVVDGTGAAPFRADVAVAGGRVAAVGRVDDPGREEVDAEGHVVTPGFIDGHTHMDAQVMWDPLGTCSCWHGVTTVVMGNCGFTLAPARPDQRHLVVRNLERAEDISAAAMAEGIDWSWETFPEYLATVDALPKGINYAANVGHSALRTWAMGERAFEEPGTDDDHAEMARQLRASMEAGAIGFTTSRSIQHETSDDRPVASRLATWEEVRRLVGVMGDLGTGVFELAQEPAARSDDPAERDAYAERMRTLALETGVPFTFGVLPPSPDPASWQAQTDLVRSTVEAGGRMFGQSHSRGVTAVLSWAGRLPFDALPEWRDVRSRPLDEQRTLLRDPVVRERLVHAAHHGDYGRAIGAEARQPEYGRMRVLEHPVPPNPTLAEVAAARGVDPVEALLDLVVDSDFARMFVQPISTDDPAALLAIMKDPRMVMTFSDAGAHVSQIVDFSIQTHFLAYWVRDRQAFTLEEGVRMLTSVPASAWGFADRGVVREGMVADLNVLDPERVAPELPTMVTDLPGGARRLQQRASGFRATLVGGQVVLRDGEHTGALPGRLLRGPLATR